MTTGENCQDDYDSNRSVYRAISWVPKHTTGRTPIMFWFYIFLVPFILILFLFFTFWIVQEGSRWQKHPYLGGFARFIQASLGRAFAVFLVLTILIIPACLLLLLGVWWDLLDLGTPIANTVPVVDTLLIMFLLLAAMIPVLWGSYRTWRQNVRSAAEVRVRSTQG